MSEFERIEIPGSSIKTTRLGFGCSNLLGDKTREDGLGLLQTAYELGIRHFDVARVYNYGDAEALVGEFASGKRDKVTITTKFGLMPREGVAKMKGPVQFVRRLMRSSPLIRKLVRRNVKSLTQSGQFDASTAQRSLEMSLRALRTDYIDIYLLHECNVNDCTDEIFSFLQRAKNEGKILAFGCGTGFERVPSIANTRPEFLQVAQFESSLLRSNLQSFQEIRPTQNLLSVIHGVMGSVTTLKRCQTSDPLWAKRWSDLLGMDISQGSNMYGLLLSHALRENSKGIVLFRAAPERIEATLRAKENIRLTDEQFASLKLLAHDEKVLSEL